MDVNADAVRPLIDDDGRSDRVEFGREFFGAYAARVNTCEYAEAACGGPHIPAFVSSAHCASDFSRHVQHALRHTGACLVRFGAGHSLEDTRPWQEATLGPFVADSAGQEVSRIAVTPNKRYYAGSAFGQPMHSDDAHLARGPRVIGLFCSRPAQVGGLTTLASVSAFVADLGRDLPDECFNDDAIQLLGSAGEVSKSLFTREGANVLCSFPSIVRTLYCSPSVAEIYGRMMEWVHRPFNQARLRLDSGDLLLIDNLRLLHGRTAFSPDEPRLLLRTAFDGSALRWP